MSTHTFTTTPDGRVITGKSERGRAVRSGDDTVQFWIEGIYERKSRGNVDPTSIIVRGDTIYSYGTHFPMARLIRDAKGRVRLVLINADTWSGGGWTSTGQHQSMVRSATNHHAGTLGIPVMEIPFPVLESASIRFDSIKPLEIRDSRWTYHEIESYERPGVLGYVRTEDGSPKYVPEHERDGVELDDTLSSVDYSKCGMAHAHATGHAELREDGKWHWTVQRHWMGDSIFRAKSSETRTRSLTAAESELYERYCLVNHAAHDMYREYERSFKEGEGYDEALFKRYQDVSGYKRDLESGNWWLPRVQRGARTNRLEFTVQRWATYLSSFDYNEPHRPYFMCELPYGCKATTVDEGVDALMPDVIRSAIAQGIDVKRQGDIYAIPTNLTTEVLESLALPVTVRRYIIGEHNYAERDVTLRRPRANETYPSGTLDILGTNHRATHMILTRDGQWYGRGTLSHAPSGREPDHRAVKLDGAEWYAFVKNTVPITGRTGTVGGAIQSHHARAWTNRGQVD